MCALSGKRNNKAFSEFVEQMRRAGKAPKVILVAVACKLLVLAHASMHSQKPLHPSVTAA